MLDVAFVGHRGLGGVHMRGITVANALGVPFFDLHELRRIDRVHTLVLVKVHTRFAKLLRRKCERLIYDPLDSWLKTDLGKAPADTYWKWTYAELQFDEIIATSPSCAESIRKALPNIPSYLAPHHADPDLASARGSSGNVVYAGAVRYLKSELKAIQAACRDLGKTLVIDETRGTPWALSEACLVLHPRLSPHDTHLNRCCKPQIKLENAAAVGLPVVASGHPCVVSLRPEVVVHRGDWKTSIEAGLSANSLRNPITLDRHVATMRELIAGSRQETLQLPTV